jgi:hypothetical protein
MANSLFCLGFQHKLLVQLGQAVTRVKTLLEITAQLRKGEMPDTQKVIGCSSDLVCGNIGKLNPEVNDIYTASFIKLCSTK